MKTFSAAPKLIVLLVWLLLSFTFFANAQVEVPKKTSYGRGFLEYLPAGYSTSTNLYPCIIFLHGSGERGDGSPSALNLIKRNGTPKFIEQGNTMCFTVNGKTECFIVLSPQQITTKGGWSGDVLPFIKWALTSYRIDPERVFVTGLSMGGAGTWSAPTESLNKPNYIAAIAPVSAYGQASSGCTAAALGLPVWAFHGDLDKTLSLSQGMGPYKGMLACNPSPVPIFTIIVGGGHNGYTWDRAYSPTHTYYNPNVYEWFLAHPRGTTLPLPPVVSAGADKSTTLPTNSISLTGTASDPDGTIISTLWTKVNGPNSPTIATSGSLTTSITGLIAGTYTFSLTATDNSSTSSSDLVTVTVAPLPPKYPPVAKAGADKEITLPVNTVTFTGSGSDSDGIISTYLWSQDSGPTTATLTGSGTTKLTASNLASGSYTFSLVVTDNDNLTGTDQVVVVVIAAPPNNPPKASAGQDKEITLPINSSSLGGSGTDTDGTITSYSWTFNSGPSTPTIATPGLPNTNVTNLVEGVYLFTLTVTDDKNSTNTDQVTITVKPVPPNSLPLANAGNDISITLPINSTPLDGSGTDSDGTVDIYLWEFTSGPNVPAITSTSAAKPTISNLVVGNYQYTLTVTDNKGDKGSDQVLIKVQPAPPNQPPVADAGTDNSITQPTSSVTLKGKGTDSDGVIATYTWTQQSGSPAIIVTPDAANTLVSGLTEGVYTFELTVKDDKGLDGSDQVVITVFPAANIPPTADAGSNVGITLPTNFTPLSGIGKDTDGTITEYLWEQVSGPSTAAISNTAVANITVSSLTSGIYSFSLTVTDDKGDKASDQVTVTVAPEPPNQPPTAKAGDDISLVLPDNSVTIQGSGTDVDGTIDIYLWILKSGPAQIDVGRLDQPALSISNLVEGIYVFSLVVTDNKGVTATDDVKVLVNAQNKAPVVNAGIDKEITLPTNSITLIGTASDPDGTIDHYLWEQVNGPNTATIINGETIKAKFSNLEEGIYVFNLWATDNDELSDYDQVQVTVKPEPPNIPPVAITGVDQEITLPMSTVTIVGSGTDSDGIIISYKWSQLSGPNTAATVNSGLASITYTNLIAGTYVFRLTVTDDKTAKGQKDINIKVNPQPVNIPPAANAGLDAEITLPINSVALTGIGTDADGTVNSYKWTQISGPSIATLSSSGTANTNANNLVEGIYVLRLTVKDDKGVAGFDEILITVKPIPANLPPIANAGGNQILTLPTNGITLNGSGSDIDGAIQGYTWAQISGPTTATTSSLTQADLTLSNLSIGIYLFRLTVTDDKGSTGFDEVNIRVQPVPANQPPIANGGLNKIITLPETTASFEGSGSDIDGSVVQYTWTQTSGPSTATLDDPSVATLNTSGLIEGTYIFRLTVKDDKNAIGYDEVNVRVNPKLPNKPPQVSAGIDQPITLPTNSITINASATDVDGTIALKKWTQQSGPNTASLADDLTTSLTASNLIAGVYVFRITVKDNDGVEAFDDVQITVNPLPANIPPVANAGSDQPSNIMPPAMASLSGLASDQDGTVVLTSWAQISGPNTSTITDAGSLNTTVTGLIQGTYVFQLTAMDDRGDKDTDEVTISMKDNLPPVAFAGDTIKISTPDTQATVVGGGVDIDGTINFYEWVQDDGPTTAVITPSSQPDAIISNLVEGIYRFTLTVTDDKNTNASDDLIITVLPPIPNKDPIALAGDDIFLTLPINETLLVGNGQDNDGAIKSYLWSQVSGPTTNNLEIPTDPTDPLASAKNLSLGEYVFKLTVTDDDDAQATDLVTVTVSDVANQPPVANAGDDVVITLPTNTTDLHGSGKDEDGSIASYSWAQLSGPSDALISDIGLPDITLSDLKEGIYEFELTVKDNIGLPASDQVMVEVLPFALTETKIPRIFSPGKGEAWKWPDLVNYQNCSVIIYNRVGAKVFEAKPYENNWDGTRNGKQLEADAYYYIISCGDKNTTGGVRIIR